MNGKSKCLALMFVIFVLLTGIACAEKKNLNTTFEIQFGDEVYANEFVITWEENEGIESGTETAVTIANSYGRVIVDNVHLRSNPSVTSEAKVELPNGILLRITSKYEKVNGEVWYYVSVRSGGYTYQGYIRSDMMELITEAQYNVAGGNSNNNTSDREILGMIVVLDDGAYLYYEPNSNAGVAGKADKDDVFYYVGEVSGWYQTAEGYWISSSTARPMTRVEEDNYIESIGIEYKNGSTGSGVKDMQEKLNTLGYYDGKISGHFGDLTEEAVRLFQRDNGISANGIADSVTLTKINEEYEKKVKGSEAITAYNSVIYNLSWKNPTYRAYLKNLGLMAGLKVKLTDIQTGLSFYAVSQNGANGNHADLEPATAADTLTMLKIYGVSSVNSISYKRRGMVMTLGDTQFVCSMYGQAHGQQNILSNNYNGQFCVHFLDSGIHAGDGGNTAESENHQAVIANTVRMLQGMEANGNRIIVKTVYP